MKRLLEFRPTYTGPILTFDLDRLIGGAVLALSAITIVALVLIAPPALSAPSDFPRPAELEKDVTFWKRIYSEVGTDAGLIHDSRDLGIVYETVNIPSGLSRRARERHTDARKKHYKQILLTLAGGKRTGLSREEARVLALFPDDVSPYGVMDLASGESRKISGIPASRASIPTPPTCSTSTASQLSARSS